MAKKWIIALAAGITLLVTGIGIGAGLLTPQRQPTRERVIVIPAGAYERTKKDPSLKLIPARIDAYVGERLVIVNRDSQTHQLGPFFIPARGRSEYPLGAARTYVGVCTLRPGSQFILAVHPASARRQ